LVRRRWSCRYHADASIGADQRNGATGNPLPVSRRDRKPDDHGRSGSAHVVDRPLAREGKLSKFGELVRSTERDNLVRDANVRESVGEAGGDPAVFVGWINEAVAEATAQRSRLAAVAPPAPRVNQEVAIRELLGQLATPARLIATAALEGKIAFYNAIGLGMTLDTNKHLVTVEVKPCAKESVRGGT
jgi:hypothetical protein